MFSTLSNRHYPHFKGVSFRPLQGTLHGIDNHITRYRNTMLLLNICFTLFLICCSDVGSKIERKNIFLVTLGENFFPLLSFLECILNKRVKNSFPIQHFPPKWTLLPLVGCTTRTELIILCLGGYVTKNFLGFCYSGGECQSVGHAIP